MALRLISAHCSISRNILLFNLEVLHFSIAAPLGATRRTFQPPFTRGLDPFAYLKDVLTRLPKATNWNIGELTPAAWAAAQKRVAACAA